MEGAAGDYVRQIYPICCFIDLMNHYRGYWWFWRILLIGY